MIDVLNPVRSTNLLPALIAAAAGTYVSDDQLNENSRGVRVVFDVTAVGTTSIVFTIQAKDQCSGNYIDLLASAAITTITTNTYLVYPGATAATNLVANLPLGRAWRVKAVVTGASSAVTATACGALCA